jgi:hypothetical protein
VHDFLAQAEILEIIAGIGLGHCPARSERFFSDGRLN